MEVVLRPRPTDLEIFLDKPGGVLFAGYKNVHFVLWVAGATAEVVRDMDTIIESRQSLHSMGLTSVHLVTDTAGLPDKGAREAFAASARRWVSQIAAVAVVIEREGFWGSAMRSAVTGIQMMAPASYPMGVFRSIEETATWVVKHHEERTGVVMTVAELVTVMRDCRAIGLDKAKQVVADLKGLG